MKLLQLLLIVVCISASSNAKFYSEPIAREHLITDLFVNYNAATKPTPFGKAIDVNVNIEMQHYDFHERDGAFHFLGLLSAYWHDPNLKWNPLDYNNITKVPVNRDAVWLPDLEVYNNAPDKHFHMYKNGIVVVGNTGLVFWSDTIEVTIYCTTDMNNWPHDRHNCQLALGSWTYDGLDLNITNPDPSLSMNFDEIQVETEYKIINFTAAHVVTFYECCSEPYVNIDYRIEFERRSSYVVIFRALALCIMVLTLLGLSIDTEQWHSQKIWLYGICFIVIVFNLLYFATIIGKFARSLPLIVIFYSTSLVLVTLAHIISLFSLVTTRSHIKEKLPARLSWILQTSFANIIVPTYSVKNEHLLGHDQNGETHAENIRLQDRRGLMRSYGISREWMHFGKFLERLTLLIYAVIYLILGSICFV